MSHQLAIIGAGNMAEAIARALVTKGVLPPSQIIAADVAPQRRELFERELQIHAVEDNAQAARGAATVLLSVKPQQMKAALAALAPAAGPSTLFISIAAGISTGFIEAGLGSAAPWRVVRTMPNTPMLVNEGVVAMAAGKHAGPADLAAARRLFEPAATVIEVPEHQIDAVTALSGSGPAYFFYLVEHMIHAGVALGLSPADAHLLATRTALGAGRMLATSADSPQELRRKVTSPGGTTEAAVKHLDAANAGHTIEQAIAAARQRSKELGI